MAEASTPSTYNATLPQASFQTRWFSALLLSGVASLSLFWLMYAIIHVTGHGIDKIENLPTIDFVRLKRDSAPEQTERKKPPPPPPAKQPPPPAKMKVDVDAAPTGPGIAVPTNLGLQANVAPTGGGGGAAVGGMMDSDLIPLQRMPPTYPAEARRAGISGFVLLELTINPDGSVRSARVLDSKPKGLFEAAAVTAVQKWRFKPKMTDGKAVEYRGTNRVVFDLSAKE